MKNEILNHTMERSRRTRKLIVRVAPRVSIAGGEHYQIYIQVWAVHYNMEPIFTLSQNL